MCGFIAVLWGGIQVVPKPISCRTQMLKPPNVCFRFNFLLSTVREARHVVVGVCLVRSFAGHAGETVPQQSHCAPQGRGRGASQAGPRKCGVSSRLAKIRPCRSPWISVQCFSFFKYAIKYDFSWLLRFFWHLLNPFSFGPENNCCWCLRLQRSPQDNSGTTVLTSPQSLPRSVSLLLFHIALVYR